MSVFRLTDVSNTDRESKEYWDKRVRENWDTVHHGLYPAQVDAMDKRNIEILKFLLLQFDHPVNVLECACGYGRYAIYPTQLHAPGANYLGIDIVEQSIEEAKRIYSWSLSDTFRFQTADMSTFKTDERFHLIFMVTAWSSIEQRSAELMDHLKTLLKPGGKIAVLEEKLFMVIEQ